MYKTTSTINALEEFNQSTIGKPIAFKTAFAAPDSEKIIWKNKITDTVGTTNGKLKIVRNKVVPRSFLCSNNAIPNDITIINGTAIKLNLNVLNAANRNVLLVKTEE